MQVMGFLAPEINKDIARRFSLYLRGTSDIEERSVELLIPQFKEEIVEVRQLLLLERTQEFVAEKVVAFLVLSVKKRVVQIDDGQAFLIISFRGVLRRLVSLSSPEFLVDLSTGLHAFVLLHLVGYACEMARVALEHTGHKRNFRDVKVFLPRARSSHGVGVLALHSLTTQ